MPGGAGHRKFYISEVDRIEHKYKADLPPGGYTDEQIKAGFEGLAKKYGFYRSLLFMEKSTKESRHELLGWSVAEFKYNLGYLAWENEIDKRYFDIKNPKK